MTGINNQKELGDYQTPPYFTKTVCEYLINDMKISPNFIIEPTFGKGNFLFTCLKYFPNSEFHGIELNKNRFNEAKKKLNCDNVFLYNEDIFNFDFSIISDKLNHDDHLLLIGNPPWVTNSELSSMNSNNLPIKSNFKGNKGLDSITGNANFDIAEYIILKLIDSFKNTNTTIAFLVKTIVARNVFKELKRNEIQFNIARILKFNAKKVFNVSADACLFILNLSEKNISKNYCEVFDLDDSSIVKSKFGFRNNKFYSNLNEESHIIDGKSCFEWRQGVKHDCSKIMELEKHDDGYLNKKKEIVDIEDTLIYPLIKSSSIKSNILKNSKKYVIITQKRVRQDTDYIKDLAPKTWNYLKNNQEYFDNRKSVIYKNSPDFSIFGIGDYSFSNYKVGISGFYKDPVFALLSSEKPLMMDDTCYFLSFEKYEDAYIAMLILNSELVQNFIKSIAFLDSKRPFTKKILQRINFDECVNILNFEDLINIEKNLGLINDIDEIHYKNFKNSLQPLYKFQNSSQ